MPSGRHPFLLYSLQLVAGVGFEPTTFGPGPHPGPHKIDSPTPVNPQRPIESRKQVVEDSMQESGRGRATLP